MKMRTLILSTSACVSLVFFGGSYLAIDRVFEQTVKDNAAESSSTLAHVTFNAMYEVMSTGWKRSQVESFIAATQKAAQHSSASIQIYRSPVVARLYGEIRQPALDEPLRLAMESGMPSRIDLGYTTRHIFPLTAEAKCLGCHVNAMPGSVLGAIEVDQDIGPYLDEARTQFRWLLALLAPAALLLAGAAVWWVDRRLERSMESIEGTLEQVNAVSDLRGFTFKGTRFGIAEFDHVFEQLGKLVSRLKDVAVDKDVLKFEIGLLEKFVITSDVVRDWRDYVGRLLLDINQVVPAHAMFSVFKVDEKQFDLEIFWHQPPAEASRRMMESHLRGILAKQGGLGELSTLNIHSHVSAPAAAELLLDEAQIRQQVKSFFVDTPKIGGIVGVGVQSAALEDDALRLVMDSVLSTLLNVVGSVKAIYKHTRDLEYYATRDPLTGLFNQRVFRELLDYEVLRSQRHGCEFSLLLIDLDNFKLVNDSYGHAVGDRFLQAFAEAVKAVLRNGDIWARYGGDEFVLILPETDVEGACLVAQRILDASEVSEVEVSPEERIKGTVSIGIATYPAHADDAKDLFLFADNMMYKAKAEGKSRIGIPSAQDVVDVFRDITAKSVMILAAIEERSVVPFFQPILDVQSGEICAYEVLSRLEVDGRLVGAGEFVEIAEKIGVIHRLDTLVMEKALKTIAAHGHPGKIFINLSPRALVLNDFAKSVRRIVADSGVDPGRIVFEITERDTVKNFALLERFLHELKTEGFRLAIDDFGSGFSSFHYLRRFPIDYLKIEGDFILNVLDSPKDRAFVHSMQSLAKELGIKVVAEFVERPEILEEMRRVGIDMAQGYYVGRPQRELLADSHWQPATPETVQPAG
ncbi:MAG: bifunctional diguanylate cyclase/phosphodiesterase [Zoogloea sp.]|nr:bifunctional diguanylate cyclase/phosphodiesterase [Zoogloea sp.]